MLKDYMKDYISAYRLSRLKQIWKENAGVWFLMFYWLIWPPIEGIVRTDISFWSELIITWTVLLPMFLALFSGMMHPVRLRKMMYLCPMDRNERRDHIYGSYHFRVGFHMILAVIGICVLIPFSNCDMLSVVEILLNDFVIAICIVTEQKIDDKRKMQKEEVVKVFMYVMAIFSNVVQLVFVSDEGGHMLEKVIILLVFCLIQLPLTVKYRKYVKKALDNAVMFEGGRA